MGTNDRPTPRGGENVEQTPENVKMNQPKHGMGERGLKGRDKFRHKSTGPGVRRPREWLQGIGQVI